MTDWFRSWHGAPTDNKWLVIARRSKVPAGIVSAVWWALLDHASQALERGCVSDFDVETYAEFSGFSEDQIEAVLLALTDKGLILNGVLIAWDRRQPNREDVTANDRQRQKRERDKAKPDDVAQSHAASRDVTTEKKRVEESRTEEKSISPEVVEPAPPKRRRSPSAKNPLNGHQADFDQWWVAYPRKVSKGRAEKAYAKALTSVTPETLLSAAQVFAGSRKNDDVKFLPYPATWLNDKGWLDESGAVQPRAGPDLELLRMQEDAARRRKESGFE